MTTRNAMLKELLVAGAIARLSALNKERDYLLSIIDKDKSTDKAEKVITESKKLKKTKKYKMSPRTRREISKRMKAYWARQR